MDYCVVQTTCASKGEADKLAALLVESKVVACGQISEIKSVYHWDGDMQQKKEFLLQLKTRSDKFAEVEKLIQANHSYEVPEIVMWPIENGSSEYLKWIDETIS